MKSVRIVCPECSSFINFDGTKDTNICKCGYTITEEKVRRTAAIKALSSKLSAQMRKKYDAVQIVKCCDEILSADAHNSDAWIYRGMATEDVSEKIACYYSGVLNMNCNEYDDIFNALSDDIANSLYNVEGEWNAVDVAMIDFELKCRKPVRSKKTDFLLGVINKVKDMILVNEDTCHIKIAFGAYIQLLAATAMLYPDIEEQRGVLASGLDDIDEFVRAFKRAMPEETDGFTNGKILEYFRGGERFISSIISEIDSRTKHLDSEDIERLEVSWKEMELQPLVEKLVDSFKFNDMIFYSEYDSVKGAQDKVIAEYMDSYIEPIIEEPEPEPIKEPEADPDDVVKKIVMAKRKKFADLEAEEENKANEEEENEEESEHKGEIAYMTEKEGDYSRDYRKTIKSCNKLSKKEIWNIIDDSYYGICEELGGLDAVFLPGHEIMEWIKFCAENDYPRAQLDYGICLLKGFGVEKDETLGKIYLKKASEADYYEATFILNELCGGTSPIFKMRLERQTPEEDAAVIFDINELH